MKSKHKTKKSERRAMALASYKQSYEADLNLGSRKRAARQALKNDKAPTA
jgi:hypothetical protein